MCGEVEGGHLGGQCPIVSELTDEHLHNIAQEKDALVCVCVGGVGEGGRVVEGGEG